MKKLRETKDWQDATEAKRGVCALLDFSSPFLQFTPMHSLLLITLFFSITF